MKENSNHGFTLVELLITILLVVIVSSGIVFFISTSVRAYSLTSDETNVQVEAQTVFNQIKNMVLNAEIGAVAFGTEGAPDDRKLEVNGVNYSALVIYNNDNIQAIIYNPKTKQLNYVTDERTNEKYGNQEHIKECIKKINDESLLAEHVSSFVPYTTELNSALSKGRMDLSIIFSYGKKDVSLNQAITLRNSSIINPDRSYVVR